MKKTVSRMKRKITRCLCGIVAILTTLSFSGCGGETLGTDFEAENTIEFVNAMGVGWNLGNTFDATGGVVEDPASCETSWGNPVTTKELIHFVKSEGFDTIRIPITWDGRTGFSPEYEINEGWIKRIKEVVGWCLEEDIFVIINLHHDDAWIKKASTKYEHTMTKYKAIWSQIAEEFGDYSNRVIFESMNEVAFDDLGTELGCELLNKINAEFVDLIRSTGGKNADRYLLIAGYCTDIDRSVPNLVLPDDDKLIVSMHYYDPAHFTLASPDTSWGFIDTWGTQADFAHLAGQLDKLKETYTDKGVPVIIGEIGCLITDKQPDSRNLYIASFIDYCLNYGGICPVLWDNGANMQVLNRREMTWDSEDLEIAVKEVFKAHSIVE